MSDTDRIQQLKELAVLQTLCREDLLFFARYFFKQRFGVKWVMNWHHEIICEALNRVAEGKCKRLIINISPRYSKTELAVINFISFGIGLNPRAKFIHLSYSDDLALENSEAIKDIVELDIFQKIFGDIAIKKDSRSKKHWKTTQGGGVYATSTGGQVTGFGAGLVDDFDAVIEELDNISAKSQFGGAIVIDDPIKPDDADYALKRDIVNNKFNSTIRNRVNSRNTPIIIIGQRTHPEDLPGFLIKTDPDEWEVISIPCIVEKEEKEEALWSFKHTLEELYSIRKNDIIVFERQYMQNPKPLSGLMYPSEWNVYGELPFEINEVFSYTDVADKGKDYLCSIIYTKHGELKYVLDVVYTQEPNEVTEGLVAERHKDHKVNYATIESNNGGRSFARNVERISRENGNYITTFSWLYQTANKETRIINNSSTVQNRIVFPDDWHIRWPAFYDDVTGYLKAQKNRHDDAPDTLTGVVENEEIGDEWATVN